MSKTGTGLNLATLSTTSRTIEILHPKTQENIGIRVTLVSLDDERLVTVRRQINDRKMYLEARGKTFKSVEIEENLKNMLYHSILSWEWYAQSEERDSDGNITRPAKPAPDFDGEELAFSKNNLFKLFDKLPWFKQQISEAVGETESFFDD